MGALTRRESTPAPALIEWGLAGSPLPGETRSGDGSLVHFFAQGVLVAVVDGLGHGDEAATAAEAALDALRGHATEPMPSLIRRCHEACRATRGVAMAAVSFRADSPTMTWVGVGNVEGLFKPAGAERRPPHFWLPQRGGVVGYWLPTFRTSTHPVDRGDTLILATDGIRPGFAEEPRIAELPPQLAATRILQKFARRMDDALVLVVRYRGFDQ